MGATRNELPDGRVVCIGGEHEDFYDPDFHIYNDVVVFGSDNQIVIYGYPKDVFAPTDFHTATLVGTEIIVIGCVGNSSERRPGVTPVYSLNTNDFRISQIKTSGLGPGWISEHSAELSEDKIITIRNGRYFELKGEKHVFKRNIEEFSLDTKTRVWSQITTRNWKQWSIAREDGGLFVLDQAVNLNDLVPPGFENMSAEEESHREARFLVRGVPIRIVDKLSYIEILAEGELPEEIRNEMPEVFRRRIETLCKKRCVFS